MIEKPAIEDAIIIACLQSEYGLSVTKLSFLPIGADVNTAVYRATIADGTSFFVKLCRGALDTISVDVPKFLHDQGIAEIMRLIESLSGALSAQIAINLLVTVFFSNGIEKSSREPSP